MALLARVSGNTFQFSNNCFNKFFLSHINLKPYQNLPSAFASCSQRYIDIRCMSTDHPLEVKKKRKFVVFDKIMLQRRNQAKRSILVQVQSENSSYELYRYCSIFGKVQEMHHYVVSQNMHFILVEFESLADMKSVSSVFTHTNIQQNLPVTSPIVWFRAETKGSKKETVVQDMPIKIKNGQDCPTFEEIDKLIFNAQSISEQMALFYNSLKLSDTNTRLRFLSARQIELSLSGIFADVTVLPFGSSVNGFGRHGCDLDLVLKLNADTMENKHNRLVYHTKAITSDERLHAQKVMEIISGMLQHFLPGITRIRKILRARVPIIKYSQTLTGLECDLSMTNTIGIYMSELLYLYGELDWRVRPLIFTIRKWAHCVQLTNSSPGSWITNFSLTLLVLFYLQKKQVIPNLKYLIQHASKNDVRIADDHVDCTFLRDISRLPSSSYSNTDKLEDLLLDFFIYYSSFDFVTKAVSLNEGTELPKPEEASLFIYNPLEHGLNVTRNMNVQETERLKIEMRNAAWILDSATDDKTREWGLLSLFNQKNQTTSEIKYSTMNRMFKVSELFRKSLTENNNEINNKNLTSTNTSSTDARISVKSGISSVSKSIDRREVSSVKKKTNRRHEGRR